jgi:cell division protein FtsL
MIRTSQILFWFTLSIAASLVLYHTSDRTRELERQLRSVNASIESEQEKIHVLKTEWVFLSNPARVEEEAKKHLTLRATAPKQVISLSGLNDALPTRAEQMDSVAVAATPIANIKTSMAAEPGPLPPIRPRKIAVASVNQGHINDRMVIQHTTDARPADKIGALIAELGSHP